MPPVFVPAFFFVLLLAGCAHSGPWRSLPDSSIPYDRAWGIVRETVANRYSALTILDQGAGYIQTDWRLEQVGQFIGTPVNRTRLLVWIVNRAPVRIYIKVERQAFSLPLGRWLDDIRPDDPILLEVATDIQNKFKPF